jgi:hypothetical protein
MAGNFWLTVQLIWLNKRSNKKEIIMLGFIKKLFGSTPAETVAEVPYKVEAPVAVVPPSTTVESFPVETAEKKPSGEKKPATKAKKAPAKKPKAVSKKQ